MTSKTCGEFFDDRIRRARLPGVAEISFGLPSHAHGEIESDLVLHGQRPDRHAQHARRVLDQGRRHALADHGDALVHVATEKATGEEAARIIDDDRRLAQSLHEIECPCERRIGGFLAADDLDQGHAIDRREKMQANEILGALGVARKPGDRQRRGIGSQHRIGTQNLVDCSDDLRLDVAILEHRFDHELRTTQRRVVATRRDERQRALGFVGCQSPFGDRIVEALGNSRLATLRRSKIDIHQHDLDTRPRGNLRDTRAHQPRAHDADLAELSDRHLGRTSIKFFALRFVDEQRAHHVARSAVDHQPRHVLALEPQRKIHRQQRPLIKTGKNCLWCRQIVRRLLVDQRVRDHEQPRNARIHRARTTWHAEIFFVPGLYEVGTRADPLLGALDDLARRHHGVDDARSQRRLRIERLTLEQVRHRRLNAEHARESLRAAARGQQADLHLGQADLQTRNVGDESLMAGERNFEATPHRRTVDRTSDGLAAGLELAQQA